MHITRNDRFLGDLVAGNLVGSALLLSGIPADIEAVATEPVRVVRWKMETLLRYLGANPETRIIMQQHLAHDLAGKVDLLSKGAA